MTEAKLKPCPFCGGELMIRVLRFGETEKLYGIQCERCGLTVGEFNSVREAVEFANTRADERWRWYSAKKHLPKTFHKKTIDSCVYYDSDPVAVVAEDDLGEHVYGIGTYYVGVEDGKTVGGWDGVTIEDVGLYACTVTHWMPLPKLPEVEK